MSLARYAGVSSVKTFTHLSKTNQEPDVQLLVLNVATISLVEEILRLPSASTAVAATTLLYGSAVPAVLLPHVGNGSQLPSATLLASSAPLSTLLPERLRVTGAWRDGASGLKAAKELARQRYRDLQAAFVSAPARVALDAGEALLRYTYGTHGRPWAWAESAKRILDRVTVLNRATLSLLASAARGETSIRLAPPSVGLPARNFDAPGSVLDALAEALPPVAMPDWVRLVGALAPAEPTLAGEESIERYQSLFAEMLGLSAHPEARS